jgi:hypothetical protein
MSCYDEIKCKYPLPIEIPKDTIFQTKSLNRNFDYFEISEYGQLFQLIKSSDPRAFVVHLYTGAIKFYSFVKPEDKERTTFVANFRCSILESIFLLNAPQKEKTSHEKVIERLKQRSQIGLQTYGKPLLPHNGRWQLKDLMEEILDAACYLQNEMDEQDFEPTEAW